MKFPACTRAVFLLAALSAVSRPVPAVEHPAWGDSAMVVAAHPLAAETGLTILRRGGNAVDAAVAVAFALAVCEPYASGLGGGGFLLLFEAGSGRVLSLDARETAPAAARKDMFLSGDAPVDSLSRDGPMAVAVPGLVRGLWDFHQTAGRLPWPDLVEPAVALARDGFPVCQMLAERIAEEQARFNPAARAIFLPDGNVPQIGTILRQEDLARTLDAIARKGQEAFYIGPVAHAIAATTSVGDYGITPADLAGYRTVWRDPVAGSYRGCTVWSMAPPSSGGVHLVQVLNILEGFDLASAGFGSAEAWHPMVEAMKFAFADRSRLLGDPDFTFVPAARLTSRAYADSLRSLIRTDRARPAAEIPGAPLLPIEGVHTSHLSVIDTEGNAVAATLTINLTFGSGWVAAGTGILLNDEMDDFAAAPGRPNAFGLVGGEANGVAPGKRPLSSMAPTIVVKGGRVRMVAGSPGGSRIITATLQAVVNVLDHRMDALQAVSAPRIHHQWTPDLLYHEPFGMSPDTVALLEERGHRLQERAAIGNVQIIVVDPETGMRSGASDPRGMGLAVGF